MYRLWRLGAVLAGYAFALLAAYGACYYRELQFQQAQIDTTLSSAATIMAPRFEVILEEAHSSNNAVGGQCSSIAVLARIDSHHVNYVLFCVDFIEETIIANSITPCLRLVVLQFLDVLSKMGIVPELRVDVFPEFLGDPFALPLEIL